MSNFKNKQLGILVILSLFINFSITANPLEELIASISAKASELKDWAVNNPKKAVGAGVGTAAALISATAGALYLQSKNKEEEDKNEKREENTESVDSKDFIAAQAEIVEQLDETKKAEVVEKKDSSKPLAKFKTLSIEEVILANGFIGNLIGKNSANLQIKDVLIFDQIITGICKEDVALILKKEDSYLSLKSSLVTFFENQDREIDQYLARLKSTASLEVVKNKEDVSLRLNQFAANLKTQNVDLNLSQAIAKAKEIILEQVKNSTSQILIATNVFLKIKSIQFGKTIDRQRVSIVAGQMLAAIFGQQALPEELFEKIENGESIKALLISK